MGVKGRIWSIRVMDKMENNANVTKENDGTMKYTNEKNEVLFEAKLKKNED